MFKEMIMILKTTSMIIQLHMYYVVVVLQVNVMKCRLLK